MATTDFDDDDVFSDKPERFPRFGWEALGSMSPAYFGMVMATGVVSIAANLSGHDTIARALFILNIVFYVVLLVLSGLRTVFALRRVLFDLTHHRRAPSFFTSVAGTSIVGIQCIEFAHRPDIAIGLWILAIIMWLGLTYSIFTALIIKTNKPTLDHGINGSWLLAVVATQSIAVLGSILTANHALPDRLEMNFFALSIWLWGGMLYIWMISLIFYRDVFFRFSPHDLAPPYWINMGAMAISTLAGSLLILNAGDAPYLKSLLPFLKGFTIFYWATGVWWIPMLIVLELWCYVFKKFPVRYDPLYWGAVFPLGMYAAGTYTMDKAMHFGFLEPLPTAFFYIALVAWAATFVGLARQLWDRAMHTWRPGAARG
ncbi:MAG TPA: tellurite resistance/C4-dicarboxylate transporter family protein [Burkholderiaceae bacterium]|nr:tellurite resistance/C4-dicarboxylate transporter family protein [Burkholderiaceae bacterium]